MDEQKLIQQSQKGSLKSFEQLVFRHQNLVYCQAYFMLNDREKAEQIAEETFVQAFRRLPGFPGGALRTWLLQIVTQACLAELRRQQRWSRLPWSWFKPAGRPHSRQVQAGLDAGCTEKERSAAEYLAALEPECKAAAILVDLQGISFAEAAQILKISDPNLKKLLARARKQLCLQLGRIPKAPVLAGIA
jgi:RNA polymerase sigma-70 factor, ECF subfamily